VQNAFHHNREALRKHGIHYVGPFLQPTEAAKAMAGGTPPGPRRDAGLARWREFLDEGFASGARSVVLSSEFLCEADDAAARRILDDFANDDTRVVVTLRPLAKIIPSQWQQFVQSGSPNRFEDWVTFTLETADAEPPTGFWRRHRNDRVVRRWAELIGPENVTVIVSDEQDVGQLPREFAALLGLPDGVLVPVTQRANRSLTWEEAEAVRHFNIAVAELKVRDEKDKKPLKLTVEKRLAAWARMKSHPPHEHDTRIELPASSLDRVESLSHELLDGIKATGVQVVGPTEQLVAPPQGTGVTPTLISPRVAADLAVGVAQTMHRQTRRPPKPEKHRSPWDRLLGRKPHQNPRGAS
jgi:hypothetical protein